MLFTWIKLTLELSFPPLSWSGFIPSGPDMLWLSQMPFTTLKWFIPVRNLYRSTSEWNVFSLITSYLQTYFLVEEVLICRAMEKRMNILENYVWMLTQEQKGSCKVVRTYWNGMRLKVSVSCIASLPMMRYGVTTKSQRQNVSPKSSDLWIPSQRKGSRRSPQQVGDLLSFGIGKGWSNWISWNLETISSTGAVLCAWLAVFVHGWEKCISNGGVYWKIAENLLYRRVFLCSFYLLHSPWK